MNIKSLFILILILSIVACKSKKQAPPVIPCPTIPDSTIISVDTIRNDYFSVKTQYDTITKGDTIIITVKEPPQYIEKTVTHIKHYENTSKLENANFRIDSLKGVINDLSNMRLEVQSKLDNSKGQVKTLRMVLVGLFLGVLGLVFFLFKRK